MSPLDYAVTLHPFDEREYLDLVLPAVLGQGSADDLVRRYAVDEPSRELITSFLPRMREAAAALREGNGVPWSTVVNFAAGVFNAHVHPAYFLGDLGLSYWRAPSECPLRHFTRSMATLAARAPRLGASISEIREGFAGPGSAGSFIAPGEVAQLIREIERRAINLASPLRDAGYDPLATLPVVLETLHYARERHLAVIELTHAVDPAQRRALFPVENLRGGWRGALHPEAARRVAASLHRDA